MSRVRVVGAKSGGVAYSTSRVIPWQKRTVEGSGIQQGGIVRQKKQKGGGGLMYYMRWLQGQEENKRVVIGLKEICLV
jgi:hypothetical protein